MIFFLKRSWFILCNKLIYYFNHLFTVWLYLFCFPRSCNRIRGKLWDCICELLSLLFHLFLKSLSIFSLLCIANITMDYQIGTFLHLIFLGKRGRVERCEQKKKKEEKKKGKGKKEAAECWTHNCNLKHDCIFTWLIALYYIFFGWSLVYCERSLSYNYTRHLFDWSIPFISYFPSETKSKKSLHQTVGAMHWTQENGCLH